MQDLKIAIVQSDIVWENSSANLEIFARKISAIKETVDLIVLPEMFNTAFSMNPNVCAETEDGASISWLRVKAAEKKCVIIASLLIQENEKYFNRLIWMNPDGFFQQYDKKHLFRFAGENEVFTAGSSKITPPLKGWNFSPLVCYDLRFPVWSMNTFLNDKFKYDCLVYIANWPEKRREAWMSLLVARAIENQAYVIGVNRVGIDGKGNSYSGDSMLVDPKGKIIVQIPANIEATEITSLSFSEMQQYRDHFRVALDWDKFSIED
jgi:predicted amidohydrolase